MTKPKILLIFFLLFGLSHKVFSQNRLVGKWMDSSHREQKVEMYRGADNKIYGKSEKGKLVFKSLVFDSESNTYHGILINPDDDKEFKIKVQQPTLNSFTFSVKQFIFSKRFTFVRQL